MGILGWLEDLGDALADVVEDAYEVFERRGDEKVADICNKIDKIEEADSIIEKVNYTLTSSKTLRSKIGRASLGKECRSRWSPYH